MGVKRFISRRLLGLSGERSRVVSVFGVTGVLLGVFSIITVVSVMYGFQDELIKRILGHQPHIYVLDTESPSAMSDWSAVYEKLNGIEDVKNGQVLVSPFVENEVILYFNGFTIGSVAFSVSRDMMDKLLVPRLAHRETALGEQLGYTNQMVRMDQLEVVSGWEAVSSSLAPKIRKFTTVDFVKTGTYARDLKYAYFELDDAMNYFTPLKGVPTGIALLCLDPSRMNDVAIKTREVLGGIKGLKIQTWEDRNQKLFYSLKLERVAMLVTLFFIILVASFSITASLVMMVESKKPDFAILSSMGLSTNELKRIVMYVAMIKGTIGAVIGGILGTVLCYLIDKYRIITLPSIYYDTYLPVRFDIGFNALIVVLAIVICVAGVLFPLRLVSKISIISELRKN